MKKRCLVVVLGLVVGACSTLRPTARPTATGWEQRVSALQHAVAWKLEGRAAVAVGSQGWQASLDWAEMGANAEVHLAGPFGVGALTLLRTGEGVSLNGAPPSDAVVSQLQERLGFELPLDNLRYWLLGVPDPGTPFDLTRDEHDRAARIAQAGWTVVYDKYMPFNGDLVPARVILSRDTVRVRIVVDHWTGLP